MKNKKIADLLMCLHTETHKSPEMIRKVFAIGRSVLPKMYDIFLVRSSDECRPKRDQYYNLLLTVSSSTYYILERATELGVSEKEIKEFIKKCKQEMSLKFEIEEKDMPQTEKTKEVKQNIETTQKDGTKVNIDHKAKEISAGFKLELDVASILSDVAVAYLESDASGILTYVGERIKEEAEKMKPYLVKIGERPEVKMPSQVHVKFKQTLETLQFEKQCLLVGPAGTGKTTLAKQASDALLVPFGHISCTAGMSEAHLLGRMVADGSYIPSDFIELYENGGVFLFDEVDAADPNTLLIVNSALSNGYVSVPNRKDKPRAYRHKDFYAICAANTWGTGSGAYSGRNILDSAFLDRFSMGKIEVEYDTKLESQILSSRNQVLANALWAIRKNITDYKMRRILSTRVFVSSLTQCAAGKSNNEIINRYFTGWTQEERNKAMTNVKL